MEAQIGLEYINPRNEHTFAGMITSREFDIKNMFIYISDNQACSILSFFFKLRCSMTIDPFFSLTMCGGIPEGVCMRQSRLHIESSSTGRIKSLLELNGRGNENSGRDPPEALPSIKAPQYHRDHGR
ncbi:hypothetical protein JTB14_027544 [Gonioctena quinquepunctata]|nr:hypothetical protein JTB14_027544 [Gonioctena quinquepunctata]